MKVDFLGICGWISGWIAADEDARTEFGNPEEFVVTAVEAFFEYNAEIRDIPIKDFLLAVQDFAEQEGFEVVADHKSYYQKREADQ